MRERRRPTRWLLLLPGWPYLWSLFLPVDAAGWVPGFWLILLVHQAPALWLPNPLLWLGIYLLDRGRFLSVLYVGTAAVLLAMLPLMKTDPLFEEIVLSPGYVTWLLAMVLLVIAGYLGPLLPRAAGSDPAPVPDPESRAVGTAVRGRRVEGMGRATWVEPWHHVPGQKVGRALLPDRSWDSDWNA